MCNHYYKIYIQLGAGNKCFKVLISSIGNLEEWYTVGPRDVSPALQMYLMLLKPKHPVVRICENCETVLEEKYEL